MKRIIVGTAGHIDHGKTSLVLALTGVDADRLKEEKERGITIDIGFADLMVGDVHFGFVDVPGHERFVKNMLAGAHGIDVVMLIVAADESVMPQTREHFDICRLLEVKSGLIVLTKVDMVDEELADLVEEEVSEYVAGSFLANAPIVRVSSKTGQGIEDLKKALAQLANKATPRDANAISRLPIDRVFTIKGFGTVITGTLISGLIKSGEELELLPSDARTSKVRGLQVHGKSTNEARAGERTAINLQGIDVAEVSRGQVLAPAGRLAVSPMLDVHLQLLKTAARPLRSRARVRLHHGTSEVIARVILLGQTELLAGQNCYAQLRLESPLLTLPTDRFIVRSYSPSLTIGGGVIVDSIPNKHRLRNAPEVIGNLEKLKSSEPLERLILLIEFAGMQGMNQASLAARSGASDAEIKQAIELATKSRRIITAAVNLWMAREPFEVLAKKVRELLKDFHKKSPLESGYGREELREKIFAKLPVEIFKAVIANLSERNEVITEKDLIRLATHRVALSADEQAAKDHLATVFLQAGLQPISLDEAIRGAAPNFGIDTARAQRFAQMLINGGELVKVGELVFHRQSLEQTRELLLQFKAEYGAKIDVGAFKDLTGVSRKFAIPLLEYFDRQRVTRRFGDAREIL